MVEPMTLSSQNRTLQSNKKHYLEKSDCQKENRLDDVMGVSNSKEHAGLQRLYIHTAVFPASRYPLNLFSFSLQTNLVSQSKHCFQYGSCCTGHKTAGGSGTCHATGKLALGLAQWWGVCMCNPRVTKDDLNKSETASKEIRGFQLTHLQREYGLEKWFACCPEMAAQPSRIQVSLHSYWVPQILCSYYLAVTLPQFGKLFRSRMAFKIHSDISFKEDCLQFSSRTKNVCSHLGKVNE